MVRNHLDIREAGGEARQYEVKRGVRIRAWYLRDFDELGRLRAAGWLPVSDRIAVTFGCQDL